MASAQPPIRANRPAAAAPAETSVQPATDALPSAASAGALARRLVRQFDFDEAGLGNFESMPMNWAIFEGPGFPKYLTARFDPAVGHAAGPSFYLGLLGGSVGGVYQGKDLPVSPACDYRVVAWIRADRLKHAGAFVTAWYRDGQAGAIDGTERRSATIRADASGAAWQRVEVDLPRGVSAARSIGLACWVVQPQPPRGDEPSPRPIRHEDVHGGAWFDDISVVRLPQLRWDAPRAPAIFGADETPTLQYQLDDPDGAELSVEVRIEDADGRRVLEQTIDPRAHLGRAVPLEYAALGPGWYRARAAVRSASLILQERSVDFVRLAADLPHPAGGGFGAILPDHRDADRGVILRLLAALGVSAVKTPLWTSRVTPADLVDGDRASEGFLRDLRGAGLEVVAVLAEPPAELAGAFDPQRRGLLDVLSAAPQRWRAYLSLLIARHGDAVRAWQVGGDDADRLRIDARMRTALRQARAEMDGLTPGPVLAAPWSVLSDPSSADMPAQILSVGVPGSVSPAAIFEQFAPFRANPARRCWAAIEPLEAGRYEPRARLADLAMRLVAARAACELVFVPAPWRDGPSGAAPLPEFLVIRAIAQATAGAVSAENLSRSPDHVAWLFRRADGSGAMIAWRTSVRGAGSTALLPGGVATRAYDLFGRELPAQDALAETHAFEPVIYTPIDSPQAELHASIRLATSDLAPGPQPQANELLLRNARPRAIQGRIELIPPPGWQIAPTIFHTALAGGAQKSFPLTIRVPGNEVGGERAIRGVMRTGGGGDGERFDFQLPVRVGVRDLDVQVYAGGEGGRLIIRQRITNRSADTLDFETTALAPGQRRQVRLVRGLAPGQTAEKTYEFDRAAELKGRAIRVSLQEVDGPRRHNEIVRPG